MLNGTFAQDLLTPSGSGYTSFQLGTWQINGSGTTYTGAAANWTNASGAYNFIFTSGTATAVGQYNTLTLADGSAIGTAPGGGNFIGNDGDYDFGTISQTITGLTAGLPATLTFWWGAGIQNGYSVRTPSIGRPASVPPRAASGPTRRAPPPIPSARCISAAGCRPP